MENKIKIPLSRPDITEKEIEAVISVLKTPYLSLGPKLKEFEEKFAAYIGTKYAIAVNSGTSGLHLAIKSLNIGDTDAVITTPFSFIASANCIIYERALPIFIDIEPVTFNIDPFKIEEYIENYCDLDNRTGRPKDKKSGRIIKAILPVHVFGHPCQMSEIMTIAKKYNLFVIEDACEAIGAEYEGNKVGTFGDASVFAFYPNKQITTGEGGMITTNDEEIAKICKSLRNQGRDENGSWLGHELLGYNYRISDINCALGISQLERIDEILLKREKVAQKYNELLNKIVQIPLTLNGFKRSWFVYVICLPDRFSEEDRKKILLRLADKGIQCSNYLPPIHLQPFYREKFEYKEGVIIITENIAYRTIALPFYNNLKEEENYYVVNSLIEIMKSMISTVKHLAVLNMPLLINR